MPTFKFTSPDGKQYTVNGPDGATEQQAFQMLQSQMAAPQPKAAPAKPFGQQMNEAIADIPRQVGLTARYGVEGVGGAFDSLIGNPIRTLAAPIFGNKPTADTGKAVADLARLPQPATANERIVGDTARMVAGSLVPMGIGAGIAKNTTGTVQAVGRTLAANPVSQMVSAGAGGAASGAVRETGGDEGSQLAASLVAGIAAPYVLNKGQQLVTSAARAVRPGANLSQTDIDIKINNALEPNGVKLGDLPVEVQRSMRKDVADAYKISGTLKDDAVRRLADYRLLGATPTAGPLSQDAAIVTQQKNLAKQGINSKDVSAQALGQTENQNNKILIDQMNKLGAGSADAPIGGARRITNALADRNSRASDLIGGRYDAARATNGRSAQLDPSSFSTKANDLLDEALLGGKLPSDVRNLLNKAATGELPLTVDVAEQFKTRIGDLQRASSDAAERKALGLVRGALDDAPLLPGQDIGQESIDAFNKARKLNRAWMNIVEKTPALAAVRDGVEPDKFVQTFIVGSGAKSNVADVAALRSSIKGSPDAMDAVRQQIAGFLKSKALGGAADEVGNVSQSNYNKALNSIGDEKLAMFFKREEIEQLKAIGRVASYEQVQPKGSAVNNSNTAGTALASILDRIGGSSLLSKVPFGNALSQPAQNIAVGIRSRQAMSAPEAIAGNSLSQPSRFAVSPLIAAPNDQNDNKLAQPKR